MNPRILFEQFPDAKACFVAGSDAFLKETDAKSHAQHFKQRVKKVLREELDEVVEDEVQNEKPSGSSENDLDEGTGMGSTQDPDVAPDGSKRKNLS